MLSTASACASAMAATAMVNAPPRSARRSPSARSTHSRSVSARVYLDSCRAERQAGSPGLQVGELVRIEDVEDLRDPVVDDVEGEHRDRLPIGKDHPPAGLAVDQDRI